MNSRVKISVLVPIYNVEEFLPECLDSLVRQTLKEIEIICINDGSKDDSLAIIKKYAAKDKRIKIIDKENSGYGDSMNQGLKKAVGEYVGIVESDDFIDLDAFEKLYGIAKKFDVEVVKSNFYEYFTDKHKDGDKSNMFLPQETDKVIDPREERHVFYEQPSIWSAIYRNDFLKANDIWFLPSPGASYQDAGFNFKVWATARRAYFTNEAFLHYRQDNPNSSVKSDGKIYAVRDEYDEVERYLKEKGLMEEYGHTLTAMRFSSYIWNMRRLTSKAAREFGKTVKKDYARIKKEGYLDDEGLDGIGRHNAKDLAIKHPNLYVAFRPLHEGRNRLRKFASKAVRKVLPGYRQRINTINLVKNLSKSQAELEEKIEKLEKTIDKEQK
ncbi:glycosyltransferase [Candidatus Saccharibacteria bacterium]|nr:glycosyltransferase [Candidatus Saccharibacteria bacterium]